MAKTGPVPKTPAQLAARGERRPCRTAKEPPIVEFPTVSDVPDPPSHLNRHGVELWNRTAPHLVAQRMLSPAGSSALSHLCSLHGYCVELYEAGERPEVAELNALRQLFVEFAVTPAAQARLMAPASSEKKNPFSRNGKKRGASTGDRKLSGN